MLDDFWGCTTHWHTLVNGVRKGGRIPGELRFKKSLELSCKLIKSTISDSCGLVLNLKSSWETLAWPGQVRGSGWEHAGICKTVQTCTISSHRSPELRCSFKQMWICWPALSSPLLKFIIEGFPIHNTKKLLWNLGPFLWPTFLAHLGTTYGHHANRPRPTHWPVTHFPFFFSLQKIMLFCESHFHSLVVISPQTGMRGTPSNAKVTSNLEQTWGLYISAAATLASQ